MTGQRKRLIVCLVLLGLSYSPALRLEGVAVSPQASPPRKQSQPINSPQRAAKRVEEFALNPKSEQRRHLKVGSVHRYKFNLHAKQFFRAVVVQEGVDLRVILTGPGGNKLFEVDSRTKDRGREEFVLYAESSGVYWAELEADAAGSYRIRVEALRPASPKDKDIAQAVRIFHDARLTQNSDLAIQRFLEAEKLWRQTGDSARRANALERVADLFFQRPQWDESFKYYSRAKDLYAAAGDQEGACRMLNALGVVQRQLKRLDLAEKSYNQVLRITGDGRFAEQRATALLNLGILYRDGREYWKALELIQESLPLWQQEKRSDKEVDALNTLGTIYLSLGKYQTALDKYKEALKVLGEARKVLGSKQDASLRGQTLVRIAELYQRLGELRRSKGDLGTALAYAQSSLAFRQEAGETRGTAVSYTVLGAIRESLGEIGAAKRMQEQALAHFRQIKAHPGEASALVNIGNLLLQNNPLEAIEYFEQGVALARQHGVKEVEFRALLGLAFAERRRNNSIAAKRWAKEALILADALEPDTVSRDEMRTPFEGLRQDCYRLLIDLLIKTPTSYTSQEDLAEAFEMIESRRQHNLWSSLTPARVREGAIRRAEPSLRAERERLEEEINRTEEARRRLESKGAPTEAVSDDLKALLEKRQSLDSQVLLNDTWVTSTDRPALASLKEAQAMLEENEALLVFELGEKRSFLMRVTSSSMNVYELPARDKIEAAFQEFNDNIPKSQSSDYLKKARTQAIKLSRILLGPVAGELEEDTIIIVPDGRLHALPFHILPDPAGEDPKWKNPWPTPLLFRHVVAYLPSVSVLKAVRSEVVRRKAPDRLLAMFADPEFAKGEFRRLPNSHKEARRILPLFPPHLRFFAQGRKATRDLVRSGILGDYQYIHFATHATNHPSHPELSSIILSQKDENDKRINGRLSQREIQDLHLKADLVVLSACKTALGNQTPGEGVVGLSQGFLYAGSASVAASLWNINDESTSVLMAHFYDALIKKKQPPAQALNTAQIEMAQRYQKESWSSPYHWGAFQLHGEWR